MPKQKVSVGGVDSATAAKSYLADAKKQRQKISAIISGAGNLNNAEATAAIREMAKMLNKLERCLALLTEPATEDF